MVEIVIHHYTRFNHSSSQGANPTFFFLVRLAVHVKRDAADLKFLNVVICWLTNEFVLNVSSSADLTVLH